MSSKILIATGGTGGHVYPAMALAQQLLAEVPDSEILFVGGGLETNRFFDRTAFPHCTINCGAFFSYSPKALLATFYNIGKGIWQSRRLIREFNPAVAVGFGSFYAFPPLVAAKMMSVPLILHEANSIPGKVNRLLSKWAAVTGVHFPETIHLLNGKAVEVGMPLRKGFRLQPGLKKEARHHLGLKSDISTILVFGGSQGARMINHTVLDALRTMKTKYPFQVLHVSGDQASAEELQKCYQDEKIDAVVKPFEERMQLAWQAADLVICRSGAGAIAEQLEFEVPGILIPFPRASENHQEHNADFMVGTVGGAVKLVEKGLTPQRLAFCLGEFLKDDGAMLQAMRHAMHSYKKHSRTKDLCSLVKELL